MWQKLRHKTEREESFKDMTLESSRRGFHRSPGTNSSVVKGNETRLVRCVNCGFVCDTERDARADEDSWMFLGVSLGTLKTAASSPLSDARDSVTGAQKPDTYYDRTVLGGCPCCGSPIYDKLPIQADLL